MSLLAKQLYKKNIIEKVNVELIWKVYIILIECIKLFYTEIVLKLLKAYKSKFNNKLQRNKNIMQTINLNLS